MYVGSWELKTQELFAGKHKKERNEKIVKHKYHKTHKKHMM